MALVVVHKIMITTALLFCAVFAARGFWVEDPVVGTLFAVFTVGLGIYLRWFLAIHAIGEE
jgi:hypothetical protein